MKSKLPISILISTKNEEKNISKCILSCSPADEIIVVDSNSNDSTSVISENLGAKVINFNWNGLYPKKRQWAIDNLNFKNDWILLLDADEEVTDKLWKELEHSVSNAAVYSAYTIKKEFHFLGKKMRFGGFSHSAVLLIKKDKAKFENLNNSLLSGFDMEVHERIHIDGKIGKIKNKIVHKDFKNLEAYIDRHNKYSTWEAELRYKYFNSGSYGKYSVKPSFFGNVQQVRRSLKKIAIKIPFEWKFWFTYHFIFCLGFLEGRRGLIASQLRSSYIRDVRSKIYELRLMEKKES